MVTQAEQYTPPENRQSKSGVNRRSGPASKEALYDAELVGRFKKGDETAFTTIMERHHKRLFAVAFGVLKNHSDAEEIAQDTFLRAHRDLGGFRGDSALATWLHRVALNLSRNRYWYYYRRRRHASVSLDSALGAQSSTTFSDLVTTDAAGPAREVLIAEFSELIAGCMTRLDAPQRETLEMCVNLRLSYAEIAERCGISIGTVKSRIARARDRLRFLMNEAYPEFNAAERRVEWFDPIRSTGGIEVIAS